MLNSSPVGGTVTSLSNPGSLPTEAAIVGSCRGFFLEDCVRVKHSGVCHMLCLALRIIQFTAQLGAHCISVFMVDLGLFSVCVIVHV